MIAPGISRLHPMTEYKNPLLTVDIIIETGSGFVLIERKNPPHGWALPGGFVDYHESVENAAIRETKEETCLDIQLIEQFHVYSDPRRDPRHHTATVVFIAKTEGSPRAADDAKNIAVFNEKNLPDPLAFDHEQILSDYFKYAGGVSKQNIFSL